MKLAMICVVSLVILGAGLQTNEIRRLRSVESYEIRPRIVAMPIYTESGEPCSVILEKRHVSADGVDLNPEMSHDEILQIFNDLAPRNARTQSKSNLPDDGETTIFDGGTLTTTAEYKDVSLQMYGKYKEVGARTYVAAIIQWKERKCSHSGSAGLRQ